MYNYQKLYKEANEPWKSFVTSLQLNIEMSLNLDLADKLNS